MAVSVGVRELRQNLSRYIARVKEGEGFVVTEHGREVARLTPFAADEYATLAARFDATTPIGRLEQVAERLGAPGAPSGTTDAFLAESRAGYRDA